MPKNIEKDAIFALRLKNLMALYQEFLRQQVVCGMPSKGLERAFANQINVSASYWSQVKAGRPLGNEITRKIEKNLSCEQGWLDQVHNELLPMNSHLNLEEFLSHCRKVWLHCTSDQRCELTTYLLNYPTK